MHKDPKGQKYLQDNSRNLKMSGGGSTSGLGDTVADPSEISGSRGLFTKDNREANAQFSSLDSTSIVAPSLLTDRMGPGVAMNMRAHIGMGDGTARSSPEQQPEKILEDDDSFDDEDGIAGSVFSIEGEERTDNNLSPLERQMANAQHRKSSTEGHGLMRFKLDFSKMNQGKNFPEVSKLFANASPLDTKNSGVQSPNFVTGKGFEGQTGSDAPAEGGPFSNAENIPGTVMRTGNDDMSFNAGDQRESLMSKISPGVDGPEDMKAGRASGAGAASFHETDGNEVSK